jgi:hypothetical protein
MPLVLYSLRLTELVLCLLNSRWQGAGRLPPPGTLHHRVRSAPEDRDLQEGVL